MSRPIGFADGQDSRASTANHGSVRRILLGAAVVTVWLGTFLVTLAATDPTPVECNDNPTTVAAICAMPGPSLLPALPLATLAAVLVALALVPRLRRAR